ncbi:MAG: type II CAAX endopeptidase family protein [Eubacteriales bacterium]|nr:type II CAAX endopeptidase family protein [Eubacteriales bacterium]
MNKTRSVNRLFLLMVIWVFASSMLLGRIGVTMNAWENMLAGELILLVPVVIFLVWSRQPLKEWFPVRPMKVSTILMTVLFTGLIMPLVTFLNAFSMLFSENYVAAESQTLQNAGIWMNLFVIAVVPAVCEEVIFRGVFYHGYRENGILKGALVCGLTFGLLHRNVNQFFYASVLGIVFCLLVEATGSIFSSMIAHFLINAWSVFLMAVQKALLSGMGTAARSAYMETQAAALTKTELVDIVCIYGLIAAVSTLLAGCVLVWMAGHCGRLETLRDGLRTKKEEMGWRRILTPSFTGAAGICLGYMIMQELL